MTTVFFVRHASAENPNNIIYGRMPGFRLSLHGQEQAKKAGQYLANFKISHIYTSPLERCFETANLISTFFPKAPITHSFELNEVESESWQGTAAEELFTNDKYELFINEPEANMSSENLTQLAQRIVKFTNELVAKHTGESIICVSHEFPMVALKLALEKLPLKSFRAYQIGTGAILKTEFDDRGIFVKSELTTPA